MLAYESHGMVRLEEWQVEKFKEPTKLPKLKPEEWELDVFRSACLKFINEWCKK